MGGLLPDDLSPVLLHVPHAGTEIPGWTRPHLVLDDEKLAVEIRRDGYLAEPAGAFTADVEHMAAASPTSSTQRRTDTTAARAASGSLARAATSIYSRGMGVRLVRRWHVDLCRTSTAV